MQVHWGHVCVTSYPYYPRRTTDRQQHTNARPATLTHSTVSSTYRQACGTESQGTALKHSLNSQQAILNIQNWKKKMGVRLKWGKKPDWLGICLKGKVTTTWCLYKHRVIWKPAIKSTKKKNLQSKHALPSWTFYSAGSCFWWTRQTKIHLKKNKKKKKKHTNNYNLSIFRQTRGTQHSVTGSLNSSSYLQVRHKCLWSNLWNILPYTQL